MADERNTQFRRPRQRHRGPGGRQMSFEKPKNFKKAITDLIKYIGEYKLAVVAVMIFAAGGTVFQIFGPKIMGHATTELAEGLMRKIRGTGGIDFHAIAHILLITLALYVASAVLSFLQGWVMTGVSQKIVYKMRREISEKINRLPMKYFENNSFGDILSRITNDVDTLGMGLNQSITMIITSTATIIGVIIMMLTISPLMTLIAIVLLPISALLIALITKKSQKYFKAQQDYLGKINGQVEEDFSGQMVIKAFNKEGSREAMFDETNNVLYTSALRSQFISGIMQPTMMFVGNVGYGGVAIAGGLLAIKGTIGIGDIQAFIQYVRNLTMPMQEVAQVMNQVQSMAAAAERVFEFLNEEEPVLTVEDPVHLDNAEGDVKFDHIKFGYDPDQVVIHDFSAEVKPGQKVAIVGPTGAGKTTMVKLLMRFYDPQSGAIYLDGYDTKRFNRKDLRQNFAMVLQDTWLFSGTIMENLRYGRPDATDEEVYAAAKAAHVDHFIRTLPGGYNMMLDQEAANISQGQKQLLTIARAILADRSVLILDEATSSVDTRTEELIQEAMDNLMKGRTSFVIAHRLSTIKDADLILVMNHGDIIEQGTHESLLEQGGFYADLYNSQFQDFDKVS